MYVAVVLTGLSCVAIAICVVMMIITLWNLIKFAIRQFRINRQESKKVNIQSGLRK
jgi:hypothetical protein